MAKKNVFIVGTGIIGSEAMRQYPKEGYNVIGWLNSKTLERDDGAVVKFQNRGDTWEIGRHLEAFCTATPPDLAVFALPSGGKNAAGNEFALMQPFIKRNIPRVLAGKAALSEYFKELEQYLPKMGINATVGGATMMLDEMKRHLHIGNGQDILLELVINGTLSYVMSGVWANRPLEAVIREAVSNKFVEPGILGRMPEPLSVFKGEVEGDIPKKLCIILNYIFGKLIGRHVRPDELEPREFTEIALECVTASSERRKYIARISTKRFLAPLPMLEVNAPGSIWKDIEEKVFIQAGFCRILQGSPLDQWVPNSGPGNAARIVQGGLDRIVKADGAGDLATVGTMIKDSKVICPPEVAISCRLPAHPSEVDAEMGR